MPDDQLREIIGQSYDRMHYPPGFLRQLTGIIASGDRTAALASVDVPTLVIHGEVDPLIQVDGGEATAKAIPGAKLVTIAGMGHDFPPAAVAALRRRDRRERGAGGGCRPYRQRLSSPLSRRCRT